MVQVAGVSGTILMSELSRRGLPARVMVGVVWWDTLTSGVIAGLVVVLVTSGSAMWLRRHRIRLEAQFNLGPDWYMVHVYNDAGHQLHIFEAWLERQGKRYTAEEGLSLRGKNLPPYTDDFGAWNATNANASLGGNPTYGYVPPGLPRADPAQDA